MGENRFKSAAQLLQEKRGPAQDYGQNAAMARGTELEPEARRLYVAKTCREVHPACLQSTRYDWLRASLDGLAINHDAVVEIKCGQSAYQKASQTRSVPDYYYGQLQHILAVTGLDSLDFWCYWPGYPTLLIPVPRNVAYIERLLNSGAGILEPCPTKHLLIAGSAGTLSPPLPHYFSRPVRMESNCFRSMLVAVPATMWPAMLRRMWALSAASLGDNSAIKSRAMAAKVFPL